MPRVVREAVVRAPVERVFRALVEERAAWMTSFREEPLKAPLAVGARIPAARVGSTSGSRYEFVVTALDPPRRLAMDVVRNGRLAATGSFDLSPVVAAAMERQLEEELAALRRHVEGAGRPPVA